MKTNTIQNMEPVQNAEPVKFWVTVKNNSNDKRSCEKRGTFYDVTKIEFCPENNEVQLFFEKPSPEILKMAIRTGAELYRFGVNNKYLPELVFVVVKWDQILSIETNK